jgi:CRISPR-associated protein Cmr3
MLIFRDGRPFGESGVFGGNSLNWPFSQTLAGMVRTRVGFSIDRDFFKHPENQKSIFKTGIAGILPMAKLDHEWQPILPPPADLMLTGPKKPASPEQGKLTRQLAVHPYQFEKTKANEGCDLSNPDWLFALPSSTDKPAQSPPFFFLWSFYEKYLKGDLNKRNTGPVNESEIGISAPLCDTRIHNALDRHTLTTEEGKLYSNTGIYLKSRHGNDIADLCICFDLTGENQPDISGPAYLGGERKQVWLESPAPAFPACPGYFHNQQFLKIILTTHGDFGGWCPDFLEPDLSGKAIAWTILPGTDFQVRLRSACIDGWDAVSGIDYTIKDKREGKGAKPMKKLVRPGSVYLIEIKDKTQSQDIACHLWGANIHNICPDNDDTNLGYGQCLIGKSAVTPISK